MRLIFLFPLLLLDHLTITSCSWFNFNNFLKHIKINDFKDEGSPLKSTNGIPWTGTKHSNNHKRVKDIITEFKTELSTEGFVKIHALGHKIKNHFSPSLDITKILRTVTWSYNSKLNKYFNLIGDERVKHDIDKEFYILHVIESTNEIYANECEELFARVNAVARENNYTLNINSKLILKEIEQTVVNEKEVNLRFVCQDLKICKRFPAFSDHLARLLTGISKLEDTKFGNVVRILKQIGTMKAPYLNTLVDDDTAFKIYKKIIPFNNNLPAIRNLFAALKEILAKRYSRFKVANGETNLNTKAVRILIDIVDTAFEVVQEDLIKIRVENVIRSITEGGHENNDVHAKLVDLCNIIEEVLKFNWSASVNEDVKFLSKVIVVGAPENRTLDCEELFTKGSKFVRRQSVVLSFNPEIPSDEFNE